MKYKILIAVVVEAKDEASAARQAKSIDTLLTRPYLKALLAGQEVNVQNYSVAKPEPLK